MERFNITTTGYRYDKLIFWGAMSIILIYLGILFHIHGFTFKPYFVCENPTCENPFYNKYEFGCTYAFGLKDCPIEDYEWMHKEYLPKGTYGKKPIDRSAFVMVLMSLLILAFLLNHFCWNRGKAIHLNIFDKLRNLEE